MYNNETESTYSSSTKRVSYSDADLRIFREECRDIIASDKPIISRELKRYFKENSALAILLKKFGFNSLKIKMRTERDRK